MVAAAVHAALFGVGRLQPLLEDPDVENIDINGCDRSSSATPTAARSCSNPVAESDEDLVELIQVLAAYVGLASPAVRLGQPAARPAAARRLAPLRRDGRLLPPVV